MSATTTAFPIGTTTIEYPRSESKVVMDSKGKIRSDPDKDE
jgi:hypothetical protein